MVELHSKGSALAACAAPLFLDIWACRQYSNQGALNLGPVRLEVAYICKSKVKEVFAVTQDILRNK